MSFKEDFFEALRSVKRDFFKESDNSSLNTESSDDVTGRSSLDNTNSAIMPNSGQPLSVEFVTSGIFLNDDKGTVSAPPPQSDSVVMEAFNQASVISEDAGIIEDDFGVEKSSVHNIHSTAYQESPQFRSFQPPDDYEKYPDISPVSSQGDGRKIYDFDPDELYADDKTIISRNTVIRGALQTDDSVRLLGQILGDIECRSNIVVAGKVRGNTSAANAYIIDAQIDGNMLCDDSINVNKDAWVLGNIRAQQAEIDGKVKGNIEIRHGVSIGPASSVIGNISTDELEVKRGAFVNGQIIMYSPSRDVIDRFEDFDR